MHSTASRGNRMPVAKGAAMETTKQQWGYGLPDQAHAPRSAAAKPGSRSWARHLEGDLLGGLTAAVLTVPVSMG
jgi:hypothetical protein